MCLHLPSAFMLWEPEAQEGWAWPPPLTDLGIPHPASRGPRAAGSSCSSLGTPSPRELSRARVMLALTTSNVAGPPPRALRDAPAQVIHSGAR